MSSNEPTDASKDEVAQKLQRATLAITILVDLVALALIFVIPWPAKIVPIAMVVTTPIAYYFFGRDEQNRGSN